VKRVRDNPFAVMMTDPDGEWDVGNVGLFALVVLVIGVIPTMILMAFLSAYGGVKFDIQALGLAVGSVCGGFAAALGALGAFRRLTDNPPAQPAPAVTTTTAMPGQVTTTTATPASVVPEEKSQYHG
jgi:uncharacterized membrane protein YadS